MLPSIFVILSTKQKSRQSHSATKGLGEEEIKRGETGGKGDGCMEGGKDSKREERGRKKEKREGERERGEREIARK